MSRNLRISSIKNSASVLSLFFVCLLLASMIQGKVYEVKDKEFFELTHSGHKDGYFVFFGAEWCGHCKQFKPTFNEMAAKADKKELKMNPLFIRYMMEDRDPISSLFKILGFPTLVYINNGKWCKFNDHRNEEKLVKFFKAADDFTKGLATGEEAAALACSDYPSTYPNIFQQMLNHLSEFSDGVYEEYRYYRHIYPSMTLAAVGVFILSIVIIVIGCSVLLYEYGGVRGAKEGVEEQSNREDDSQKDPDSSLPTPQSGIINKNNSEKKPTKEDLKEKKDK